MALVALGIETSGMKQGEAEAVASLKRVEQEMAQAERQADRLSRELGTNLTRSKRAFGEFEGSVRSSGLALRGLSGPVGEFSGGLGGLTSRLGGLTTGLGLVGGAATAATAALTGLFAMAKSGSEAAQKFEELAQKTGQSVDEVQRLKVGAADLTNELRALGGVLDKDTIQKAAAATHEFAILERQFGATKIQIASELNPALSSIGTAFQEILRVATPMALELAGNINLIVTTAAAGVNSIKALRDELGKVPGFNQVKDAGAPFRKLLTQSPLTTIRETIDLGDLSGIKPPSGPLPAGGRTTAELVALLGGFPSGRTGGGGALRAAPTATPAADAGDLQKALSQQRAFFDSWRNIAAAFYDTQIFSFEQYTNEITTRERQMRQQQLNDALFLQGQLEGQLARIPQGDTAGFARVTAELEKMRERVGELGLAISIKTLPEIDKLTERLRDFGKLTLPLGRAPSIDFRIPGVIDPGAAPSPGATRPRVVDQDTFERRARDRERIGAEFGFIFEDFAFQIASARKGLGPAFGDFALGMVDVFASEFARAFQRSLQDAFISPLTNWLEGTLSELFSGISGKGVGKFFGGLLKSVFGGFFAEGGTLQPNSWGIVGERGREIAWTGSQPMHIAPMGAMAGGGGITVQNTFNVTAPGGRLDQRSMDQMSEQILRSVERAQRNRGA